MSKYEWLNYEKSRFYTITVLKEETEIVINHVWGGCNSNRGGRKVLSLQSNEEVQNIINRMMKRRKSRGYELVAPLIH